MRVGWMCFVWDGAYGAYGWSAVVFEVWEDASAYGCMDLKSIGLYYHR